jgi:hypothetical protein
VVEGELNLSNHNVAVTEISVVGGELLAFGARTPLPECFDNANRVLVAGGPMRQMSANDVARLADQRNGNGFGPPLIASASVVDTVTLETKASSPSVNKTYYINIGASNPL